MILRTLRLRRFGQFADGEFEFAPGLTVIRGPNEAGKSTMREAIVRLLLPDKKVDTTSTDFLALKSWSGDQRFVLAGEFEAGGASYELVRDFEAKRVELRCADTGEVLTDEPAIAERMWELLQVGSREIYETTACLAQQEFVRLQAGEEVAELLQQTVAGAGAQGGAQAVLSELDGQIGSLVRGWRTSAAKNPGPIKRSMVEIDGLREEIARLAPIAKRATDAADRIARARERGAEVEQGLGEALRISERAQERRKLEAELAGVSREFAALDARARKARDLSERITAAEEKLASLPDVTRDQVEDLAKLIDEAERAQTHAPEAAEAAQAAGEAAERAQEQVRQVEERAPDEHVAEQARGLERDVREMQDDAERADALTAEAEQDLKSSRAAAGAQRSWLIGAGVLVVAGAGLALGLGVPWLWLIAVAGLVVGVMAAMRGPRIAVAEAEKRHADAARHAEELQAKLTAARDGLAELLRQAGADDSGGLTDDLKQAREAIEQARKDHAAADALAQEALAQADRARQQAEITQARLDHRLEQLGAESAAAFEQATREVFMLREERDQQRRELKGVLGGQEPAEIDGRLSELAADRMGLQQRLDAEELASAAMDAERFESLQTHIVSLEGEREQLREQIDASRGAADHPDADPERLRRLEEQLAAAEEDLGRVQERRAALELAHELLAQAHEETLAQAIDVLEPSTSELLAAITGGRYCEVQFNRTTLDPLVLSAEKGAHVNPDEVLSCATREQVYLSARLALTRLLWPDECPPIMLDDPFVNFDPTRREQALQVVRGVAQSHQVLLFTCHDLYDAAADLVVELPKPTSAD